MFAVSLKRKYMPLQEMPTPGEKTIDTLEKICEDNGINIYDLFREAKKPVSTIQNWKKSEPQSLETLAALRTTLAAMLKEKRGKKSKP